MIKTNLLYIADTIVLEAVEPTTVVTIWLCNNDTDVDYINIHVVPAGQTRQISNRIYNRLPIQPQDTYVIDMERIMLDAGDRIIMTASNDAYTACVISAMEGV